MQKTIIKSYKFRLYPTSEQAELLDTTFKVHGYVYNRYLHVRKESYEATQKTLKRPKVIDTDEYGRDVWLRDNKGKVIYEEYDNPTYDEEAKTMSRFDCSKALTAFKKTEDGAWLNDYEADAFGYTLKDLDAAYQNFFRGIKKGQKVGYPLPKTKRHPNRSYTTRGAKLVRVGVNAKGKPKDIKTQSITDVNAEDNWQWLYIPCIGNVKIRLHRLPFGDFNHVTISKSSSGKYFAAINCDNVPHEFDVAPNQHTVGVDVGITTLMTLSNGEVIENNKFLKKALKRLAKEQRRLSRKQPGSANYNKQKLKVAKCYEHVANQRADATHNATKQLILDNQVIALETLDVKSMLRKKKISRQISDANFAEIRRQLEYKGDWYDREVIAIDQLFPSTQICSNCGEQTGPQGFEDLRIREWTCPNCGTHHIRCINSATNIKNEGERLRKEQKTSKK